MRATADFYETLLELRKVVEEENLAGLEAGAFRLHLDRSAPLGPVPELCVPDLPGARAAVLAAGCRIEGEDAAAPRCSLRDPFGLCFTLAQSEAR